MSLTTLLYILLARWRVIAGISLGALLLALAYILVTPRTYTSTTELLVDSKAQDPISGQLLSGRTNAAYLATQADIVRSRKVAAKVIDQLSLHQEPGLIKAAGGAPSRPWLMGFVREGLVVNPRRDTSILAISFISQDPQLAAKLADGFAQAYIQTNLELRIEPARQISEWYDQQLTALRAALMEKQNALASYQEEHGIVDNERVDLESAKLAALSSLLTSIQNERLDSESRSTQLSAATRNANSAQALDDPQVQRISTQLVQAQARLAELGSQVGNNHPQYRQAQAEVDTLKRQLNRTLELVNTSLRSSVALSQTREEQLKTELAAQKEQLLQLNRIRNQRNLLRQEVDSAQAAYDAALTRATQTRLESQISQTDIALLNAANLPSRPTAPKTAITLVLALVAGLMLGTGLALCLEWFDRRLRTGDDLTNGLGLPILARLPDDGFGKAGP
ncbi:Wzz/FepE/Etk N-terminal domain-containing protein [Cellvibrio japonicus]|uniref:Putative chain length determinant protein EpsF n=1 Tax=Cellvibrio japonicus (strain Ueda107) TaxID=498211 RepID=B3PJL7_CELJU|nr:Wzz/FepE/Etk N-terminal domain-containing protein [Cellvibrio japonicus]ACE83162.1 putative chain length determinant protein EpsF [Cellvibrio japonicus Ueda107]QEI11301.1 chain-length determining protein [Cellvibrio japonicus]QEI14875.1 chain-length determining protein [Cellvibrio japonicus]QEI18455.1 chain-length determining protein [Cellvibrio japonicus]